MGDYSSAILNLRPRTYTYIEGDKSTQPCLIAEEVESVMKSLVYYKDDQPENVLYTSLIPMLLNEIIKLNKRVEFLEQK